METLNFGLADELAMDKGEAEFLYGLVRAVKPEVCFEIGTHKGFSTQYIVQGLIDNDKGHLWTTDPTDFGIKDRVKFECRKWVDFLFKMGKDVKFDKPIDFVFVDGHHTIDDVLPEIENLLPQLADNAIVVFHDAQDEPTNWKMGVNAAIKKSGLKTTWIPTKYCLQIYHHKK